MIKSQAFKSLNTIMYNEALFFTVHVNIENVKSHKSNNKHLSCQLISQPRF